MKVFLSLQETFPGTKSKLMITDKSEIANEMENLMAKYIFVAMMKTYFFSLTDDIFYYVYDLIYSSVRTTAITSGYMEVGTAMKMNFI